MPMNRSFGSRTEFSDGLLARLFWPEMARLNEWTPDGRRLSGEGGDVLTLPRTVWFKIDNSAGHSDSIPIGRIDYVEFDEDGNVMSGEGWMVDTPEARGAYTLIKTQALYGNSIDLGGVIDYQVEWTDDFELKIDFTQWSVAATTIVGKPAFSNAHSTVGELLASLADAFDDDELVADGSPLTLTVGGDMLAPTTPADRATPAEEVVASAAAAVAQPAAPYFQPEPDAPQPLRVNADGWVSFHLGDWNVPHAAFQGRKRYIPRSRCNYAEVLRPGSLVEFDNGDVAQIETMPIFLYTGHTRGLGGLDQAAIDDAYGGTENAWCDVRIHDGAHGPWACGLVRADATAEQIHTARASQLSGHWIEDELRAIVSVNVDAFNVKGSGKPGARFAEINHPDFEHDVLELVASFDLPGEEHFAYEASKTIESTMTVSVELDTESIDGVADQIVGKVAERLGFVVDPPENATSASADVEQGEPLADPDEVAALRAELLPAE